MILDFEKNITEEAEKGDVVVMRNGAKYLIVQGSYTDEIMLVNLKDFGTSVSEESLEDIISIGDVLQIIKSKHLMMGVI